MNINRNIFGLVMSKVALNKYQKKVEKINQEYHSLYRLSIENVSIGGRSDYIQSNPCDCDYSSSVAIFNFRILPVKANLAPSVRYVNKVIRDKCDQCKKTRLYWDSIQPLCDNY